MKILFFSPHAYYAVHALPEALVAEALKYKGHEIIYVACNNVLNSYCLCMSSIKSDSSIDIKNKTCNQCKINRDQIISEFHFNTIFIEDFINKNDLTQIDLIINNLNNKNFIDFEYNNISVAKMATYEILLNRKLNSFDFNEEEWSEYKLYLKNTLITTFAAEKIIQKYKPNRVVTYNSLYSINNAVCSIANKFGILNYTLHAGSHHKYRLSEMTIFRDKINSILINKHNSWYEYKNNDLNDSSLNSANEHILALLEAKSPWVYSIKSQKINESYLKLFFNIKPNQKVLLAIMSSADERFAASTINALPSFKNTFFKDQLEWIDYLINLCIQDSNLFLIIRVHPREFPNKRENVTSKQAKYLKNIFRNLPHNVKVNYPSDNISLHDLIKITDVGLNSTSTAGLELLLFGIPVIVYDSGQLFSYPIELNIIANSKEEIKLQIYKHINSGSSIINSLNVFKWISFKSEIVSIDISDGFKYKNNYLFFRILNKIFKTNFSRNLKSQLNNRGENLKNFDKLTYAIETGDISHFDSITFKEKRNTLQISRIKKYLTNYSEIIASNEDFLFKNKIKNL
jgi:hypothetical protein